MGDVRREIMRMLFHRDDAVAHRLSLSGDRPLAKKGVTSSYLGEYL
jgi:hypothetical protein